MKVFCFGYQKPLCPGPVGAKFYVGKDRDNQSIFEVDWSIMEKAEQERKLALLPPPLPWENENESLSVHPSTG